MEHLMPDLRLRVVVLGVVLAGCAAAPPDRAGARPPAFEIGRDTFAFANLVRAERPGWNDDFANYCLVMVRAASQFYRGARFDPALPPVGVEAYTRLAADVLARAPWAPPAPAAERVVIPGYPDLHAFSRAQETAIKTAFGGQIPSMVHPRTWRVGVAFSPAHQAALADELVAEVDAGRPAPLMITNFPHEDLLNHAVLVYGYRRRAPGLELLAYDPNDPGSPMGLVFDEQHRSFWVPPLPYSPPGRIRAFRLYTSPLL
jgi:hypothetical protein